MCISSPVVTGEVDCDAQQRKTEGGAERSDAFFRAITQRRPPPPQVRSPSPVTMGEERKPLFSSPVVTGEVDRDAQHRETEGDAERSDAFFRAIT
jgi:hypothetical protein